MPLTAPRLLRRLHAVVAAAAGVALLTATLISAPSPAEAAALPATAIGLAGTNEYRVLDVAGTADGSPVTASRYTTGGPADPAITRQRWVMDRAVPGNGVPNYSYQIRNVKTGKCLDRSAPTEGATVVIKTCAAGLGQQWYTPNTFVTTGVTLKNRADALCLESFGTDDGIGVSTSDCSFVSARWKLRTGFTDDCAVRSNQAMITSLCVRSGVQNMYGLFGTWHNQPMTFAPLNPQTYTEATRMSNYLTWRSLDATYADSVYDMVEFGVKGEYYNSTGEQFYGGYWLEIGHNTQEYHAVAVAGAELPNNAVHSYITLTTADHKQWDLLYDFNPVGTTHLQEGGQTRSAETSLDVRYLQAVALASPFTNRVQVSDGNSTWRRPRIGATTTGEPKTCDALPTAQDPIVDIVNNAPWCFTAQVTPRAPKVATDPYEIESITIGKPGPAQGSLTAAAVPAFVAPPTGGWFHGVDQQALAACIARQGGADCLTDVPGLAACVAARAVCNQTAIRPTTLTTPASKPAMTIEQARATTAELFSPTGAGLQAPTVRTTAASALTGAAGSRLASEYGPALQVHVVSGTGSVRSLTDKDPNRYAGYTTVFDTATGRLLYACAGQDCMGAHL